MDSLVQKQIETETSVLYIMSIAMDLIMRDCERRMRSNGAVWKKDKKKKFEDYLRYVRVSCSINDSLTQDIYDAERKNQYQYVDMWLRDGNELARLILLFADRSADQDAVDKIFSTIRSIDGSGIITEQMLKNFYLK